MFVLRKEGQTKEEALRWKTEFEDSAQTTFRVSKTYGENSEKIIFKKKFHCIHNIFPKPSYKGCHEKHTKRQARLDLLVKPQMKSGTASALKHRPPTKDLEDIFEQYFSSGHSPSSALELFNLKLFNEHGDDYYKVVADGGKCPTRKWCYDLFY
ncbi:hypothetical protein M8J75_004704 [Diaphorina citri]|nr:hypothetical protein M8J75_004704 [Diaphorina citri]